MTGTVRNWLRAKPWRWHFRSIYRTMREPQTRVRPYRDGFGRVRSAWYALTFPHVHDESEN